MMNDYNQNFNRNPQPPKKERSPYLTKKMGAILAALCILASGSAGFAGGVLMKSSSGVQADSASSSASSESVSSSDSASSSGTASTVGHSSLTVSSGSSTDGDLTVSQIAAQTANSVVEITTESTTYDMYMRQTVSEGAGSGVILTSDGYIVTNNHVIEGAEKITVTLKDGTSYPGKLVGTDSQGDIAVVKIEATGLQPAVIGDSSTLQVGDMMAFIQYAMHVIMSFLFISIMFIMVPRASVSAERINEILTTENKVADPKQPKHFAKRPSGLVEFKDVSFRYDGADADVLEHITFTAQPGQTTAFIGSTGSGKSTLINLIPRFYDATHGSVTVDGIDVRDLSQQELRDQIGYVPQKGMLFSGTVASNLRYANAQASDQLLEQSAQVAQADEFIRTLEKGYDTEISQGGTNVSGGQRQRLSIARALVKKPPIYIFDDTFSALDFKTDAKLRKALKGYTENATVFIVAQRVSTIMQADQIVVLDEGKIVGIGKHEDLLKNCETYREIAESQLSKEELA